MPSPRLLCKQRYKMRREGSIYKEWGKRKPELQAFSPLPVLIGSPVLVGSGRMLVFMFSGLAVVQYGGQVVDGPLQHG